MGEFEGSHDGFRDVGKLGRVPRCHPEYLPQRGAANSALTLLSAGIMVA